MSDTIDHLHEDMNEDFGSGYYYGCDEAKAHPLHIENPSQYDKNGVFIKGSGETCPSCGTEWEDHFAVAMCPCHDGY